MKTIVKFAAVLLAVCAAIELGSVPVLAARYSYGNLYGAAEWCRISTAGLPYYNGRNFQSGRQRARQSRQNCAEVKRTARAVRKQCRRGSC